MKYKKPLNVWIVLGFIVVVFAFSQLLMGKEQRLLSKAKGHMAHGRFAKAAGYYEKALEVNSQNPITYHHLGRAYFYLEKPKKAEAAFEKAITWDARYFDAYVALGFLQTQEGFYRKALDNFQEALRIRSNEPKVHMNLASVFHVLGKEEKAVEHYKKALEYKPDWFMPYYNLGLVHLGLNRKEEAEGFFKKVIELNPEYVDAYTNLALLSEEKGEIEQAVHYWKKRVEYGSFGDSGQEEAKKRYFELTKQLGLNEKV